MRQIPRIARRRDELILDERRKASGAEMAEPMLTDMSAAARQAVREVSGGKAAGSARRPRPKRPA